MSIFNKRFFLVFVLLIVFGLSTSVALAAVTVTPATGGSAISASTAGGAYTTLTGPTVVEGVARDIPASGTFVLNAPTGFSFNTGAVVTATVTRLAGSGSCFQFNSNGVTPTASKITYTVTARDSNSSTRCQVSFSNIQVRPTASSPLASGNILNTGTNTGFLRSTTNYGTLTEVAGAINSVTVSPSGAQSLAGGATLQFTAQGLDAYGNSISGLTYTWAVVPGTGTGSVNSSGLFTAGNPGTVTVTASNGGKTGSSGTITISKLSQTITFGALADKQYGAADFAVTASASSGLTVSFTSQTPTICTVTTGTVHLVAVGTCTIRASQAGNSSYNPAPDVDQSFGVTTKALTVTGITAESKPYDSNTTATISTTGATLVGVVGSDVVTLNTTSAVGTFDSATVGTGKTVNISGLTLAGANAGNYSLTQPTATADIYALNSVPVLTSISPDNKLEGSAGFTLTVDGSDFVTGSKVYFADAEKTTTYVSATRLTASILASDVLASATTSVYVASPTPGGGTSTPQTFTIVPAVTKFVILPPGNGNVDGPLLVTIQAQKSSGEVATGYSQDVTLVASGSVTGEGLVNITNGVGTIEISDMVMENVHLSLTDSQSTGLDVSSTQDISFLAGATKKLAIAGDGSAVAGARTQLTVTRNDQHDNLVTVGSESFNLATNSTGPVRFYDAVSGGNVVTTILISNGNSSASVWYYDEKAGSASVTVSSNDTNVTEDSATITITPASTASFYLNDPGDLVAGNRLAYTVTRKDQFGNLVTAGSDSVSLFDDSTNSSAVFYDLASGGSVITSVSIPDGASTKDLWFYADRAENITVTASDNASAPDGATGINDVSDSLTVSAGPTAKFLLNNPGDMSVGNRIAYTVSRTDAYDTPTTEGDSTVYLYNNSTGTSTLFYDSASGGNTITSTIIPAGNDSIGFWFGSDDAGTFDVKASDNSSAPDGATGIADSQDSIVVNPLPIVATRFIIIDPTDAVAGETVPVTVKAVDGAGNIDATYQNDVTLKTNGNATPGGVVDIINGIGEINITDTKAETVSLTLEDSQASQLDVSSSQSVIFSAGPTAKFTVSDPGNAVAGVRSAYTVTRFDQYDNQVTSGLTTFYLYSNATAGTYAFYDAGSEGGQITSASILNNSATANVWFEGDKVGAWMISASDNATAPDGPDGLVDGTDNIEITAAATSRLELNDPGDMQAGTKLGYTATRYDRFSNLVTNGGATYYPYSNAGGTATAFYSSSMSTTPIASVSFSEGQSTADFWYGESKLGLWTVSLSDNSSEPDGATGIVDGEDAVTVSSVPIVATKFIIIDPANVYVGTPVEVTVRATNDDGDIDTTYQSDVTLKVSGSATGEGLVNIVNGVGQRTINDTKEETVTLSLDDTQATGLDTSSSQTVTFSITAPLPSGSGGGGAGAVTPRVSFTGRSFPGAKLTILAIQDGQVPITKQSTGSANGTFQINFSDDLPVGAQTFAVKAVDKNNLIAQTKIYKLGANEQLSQKILISPTVDLRNSIVTRGTNLGIIGSAMPKYKVEAFIDGKSVGVGSAGSNGQYTILPNTYQLELGDHAVKVKQIDATGQASDFSIEKKFRVVNTFIPKADLNDDGVVNVQDWSIFMAKWKSTDLKGREVLDMNGDGKVDTQDFGTFMKAFGK